MEAVKVIEYLVVSLIGAYAFIFKSVLARVSALEKRPLCNSVLCERRFDKIESKQSDLEPVLSRIERVLASIEPLIDILMKDYDKRQK